MSSAPAACDFCGLPLPPAWGSPARSVESQMPADPEPQYCCLGCRIAANVTRERGETGAARWMLIRLGLSLFLTLNVLAFSMALWTRDVYVTDNPSPLAGPLEDVLRYLCLLFSLPVLYLLGLPLATSAWQALRRGSLSTDLLLVTGVAAAYLCSVFSVVRDEGPIYFEVGCVILVMVTLGRWLEATGKLQAGAALDELQKLLPERVRVNTATGERDTPLADVRVGDRLRVLPGERFPTDGRLISPELQADEQIVTGESRPVLKRPGDLLCGGTLNLDADCLFEAASVPGEGTLSRLIELVRRARESKGSYQRLADRLAAWAFPLVTLTAVGAGIWHGHRAGVDAGILAALSVVLVACPCALGLATPLAVWAGLGLAARRQVLFRDGESLERLARIQAVRFDKTGTLTTGRPRVTKFICDDESEIKEVVAGTAALARSSSHPFAGAIGEYVEAEYKMDHEQPPGQTGGGLDEPAWPSCTPRSAYDVRQISGCGVIGSPRSGTNTPVLLGSRRWMSESGLCFPPGLARAADAAEAGGSSLSLVGWDGRVRGVFVLSEELRPTAAAGLARCRHIGLDVAVLTGDHRGRGRILAGQLGVPVQAELSPAAKLDAIRSVQRELGPVAMVGDGVNDAPALAASEVGVALGCGADVSRDSAAVCLLSDDPARFAWSVEFARRAVRTIRRNLLWAFAYNSVGIALACTGHLNPALAALLMVVSSLLVIGNALRLGVDFEERAAAEPIPMEDISAVAARSSRLAEVPQSSTHRAFRSQPLPLSDAALVGGGPT